MPRQKEKGRGKREEKVFRYWVLGIQVFRRTQRSALRTQNLTPNTQYPIPNPQNSKSVPVRRGLTVLELLVTALIMAILMLAAFALFRASWQSYDNLVWQTKVNMEARQSLDDICDMLRMGGNDVDMMRPTLMTEGQVDPSSTANRLVLLTAGLGYQTFQVFRSNNDNIFYLTRRTGANMNSRRKVGQFLRTVQMEYEYRLPATSDSDPVWRFVRVSTPGANAAYLATTVYVTVTAEVQPYPNGTVYRRTLTGAVALRGPHGLTMPPAQYNTIPPAPEPGN